MATFSPLFMVQVQAQEDNLFLGEDLLSIFLQTITLRNSLIPHFYTILLNSTSNGTLLRPIFFAFPNDTNIFDYPNATNNQFMVGKSLMVTPILEEGSKAAYVYFPSANWLLTMK